MPSETYEFLKKIASGEEVDRWRYPDELIYSITPSKFPNSTKITISFENDDDFLYVLGIEEDDDKYVWRRFMGNYYGSGIETDWYRWKDEWDEGYIIDSFNEENREKVKEILKFVYPELELTNETSSKVSKFLADRFESQIEYIINEYGNKNDECTERAVRKVLEGETENPFYRFGIIEKNKHYKYETTVGILLNWYKTLKAQDEDLRELLRGLIDRFQKNISRGDWYELEYNSWCNDYDTEGFQRETSWYLDKILEEIEENLEDYPNVDDYRKLYDKVMELGGFNKYIELPKSNETGIRIHKLDPVTNKVELSVIDSTGKKKQERRKLSLDELNSLLYNYELFEQMRKIIKTIL